MVKQLRLKYEEFSMNYFLNKLFFVQEQASPQKSCKKIKLTAFLSSYENLFSKFTTEFMIFYGNATKFTAEDATKT